MKEFFKLLLFPFQILVIFFEAIFGVATLPPPHDTKDEKLWK